MSDAPAVVLGDRYRLDERLAAGGMGTVWRAEDTLLHRDVAVKVLNEGMSSDDRFVERFRREAKAAAGLLHPNVAGVFDYGEEQGRPFIVMELIEGETLADALARRGRFEPSDVASIGAGVAEGLAAAHAAGFVHRDVKPANVMLTDRGDVKVMDFGIAAPESGTGLTGTGMVMGTARYLAPEQAAGQPATPASDVYALGIVLYELLTGTPPFDRESPLATAMAHVREDPPPVASVRADTPPWLAALVDSCLAKDPSERPAGAAELAAALRQERPPATGPTSDEDEPAADLATEVLAPVVGTAVLEPADPTAVDTPEPAPPDAPMPEPEAEAAVPAVAAATPARDPPASPEQPAAPVGPVFSTAVMRSVRPKRRPRLPVVLAIVGVAVVLIVVLVLAFSGGGDTVKLTDFVGKTIGQATAAANHQGVELKVLKRPSDQPANIVISQVPAAGTEFERGGTVILLVSTGPSQEDASSVDPAPATPAPPPEDEGGKDHGKHKGKGPKEQH
jgi:serine/threonine-protein kinase